MIPQALALVFLFMGVQDAIMPQPTKEQIAIIKKMGDDDFRTREKASRQLGEMGRDALLALERHGVSNPDPEIARRSKTLIGQFYSVSTTKTKTIPRITGLFKIKDGQIKLPSGKTYKVSKGTAKDLYEAVGGTYEEDYENEWRHENATQSATVLLRRNLLRGGYSKEDVRAILDAIEDNESTWQWYDLKEDEDNIECSGQYRYRGHGG